MKIAGKTIGLGHAPYVIAELGVNHDGDLAKGIMLVDQAQQAGADAIKVQIFDARMLMSRACELATYQSQAGETDPLEMLQRLQLAMADLATLRQHAASRKLAAIATVFSVDLVGPSQEIGWDAYKTASPDVVHRPLLEALAKTGRPLIVSTGASTIDEVTRAIGWLAPFKQQLAMLQCVSSYPTASNHAALGGIAAIQQVFDGPVGYSDHTTDRFMGASAVAMGACILEKHMTYDHQAKGPDHHASLTMDEMMVYVAAAKGDWSIAERVMEFGEFQQRMRIAGDRRGLAIDHPIGKSVHVIEQDVRRVSRQSIVLRKPVAGGEMITPELVCFKRPGTGILASEAERVVGRRTRRDVAADVPVMPDDVEGFDAGSTA
jgi:N,N'-diacetyllegionaminate synthase